MDNINTSNNQNYYDRIPAVLSVQELADYLKIGRNQAYALISAGSIRCIRIGRTIRIPGSSLIDYLEMAS